jgi:hypothetical protein
MMPFTHSDFYHFRSAEIAKKGTKLVSGEFYQDSKGQFKFIIRMTLKFVWRDANSSINICPMMKTLPMSDGVTIVTYGFTNTVQANPLQRWIFHHLATKVISGWIPWIWRERNPCPLMSKEFWVCPFPEFQRKLQRMVIMGHTGIHLAWNWWW